MSQKQDASPREEKRNDLDAIAQTVQPDRDMRKVIRILLLTLSAITFAVVIVGGE